MMSAVDERRLRRELESARELAGHQLAKIRRLEATIARLERELAAARRAVAELVAPVDGELI